MMTIDKYTEGQSAAPPPAFSTVRRPNNEEPECTIFEDELDLRNLEGRRRRLMEQHFEELAEYLRREERYRELHGFYDREHEMNVSMFKRELSLHHADSQHLEHKFAHTSRPMPSPPPFN